MQLVLLDLLAQQVIKVPQAYQDLQDQWEQQAQQERQVRLVKQAQRVIKEVLEQPVLLVLQERWDILVAKDHKVFRELL